MAIKILTDSTSDITQEEGKAAAIVVVPLNVLANGKTYEDGVNLTTDEFYEILAQSDDLPSTSQPSPEAFLPYFREAKEKGDSLIVPLIGSCISGTVQSANIAKEMTNYDKIYIIDSDTTTCGLTLLVNHAQKMIAEGRTAEEIVTELEDIRDHTVFFALLDTLDYLVKGGRISKTVGAVGSLIKLKPLVTLHRDGIKMVDKARGTQSGYKALINHMHEEEIDENYPLYLGYTHDQKQCLEFREIVEQNFQIKDVQLRSSGCVIGTHAGPGTVIVSYVKKK